MSRVVFVNIRRRAETEHVESDLLEHFHTALPHGKIISDGGIPAAFESRIGGSRNLRETLVISRISQPGVL